MTPPRLPIVGIGASAGGIEAFRRFFEKMPGDTGMGFVVVLHLAAGRKSMLPEIIAHWTSMPVSEAQDGEPVEANHVHVIPAGVVATLRLGRLWLRQIPADAPRETIFRLAICKILRSRLGHDFSQYKEQTFMRRVQRRMQVLQLTSFDDYVTRLETDRDQVVLLFRDLLISVTSFFRDVATFAALETEHYSPPVRGQGRGRPGTGLGAGLRDRRGGIFTRDPASQDRAPAGQLKLPLPPAKVSDICIVVGRQPRELTQHSA